VTKETKLKIGEYIGKYIIIAIVVAMAVYLHFASLHHQVFH